MTVRRTKGAYQFGGPFLDPNAHRCLRSARIHLWHAWTCVKSATRHQWKGLAVARKRA